MATIVVRPSTNTGALEAYTLVLGVRGPQWRLLASSASAFSELAHCTSSPALCTLAQASLACALQVCTFTNRVTLARDALAGKVLRPEHIPPLSAAPAAEQHSEASEDTALLHDLLHTEALRPEAAVSVLHVALRKRGGASLLSKRLPSYLYTAQEMLQGNDTAWFAYEDDAPAAEAPRSVKTL